MIYNSPFKYWPDENGPYDFASPQIFVKTTAPIPIFWGINISNKNLKSIEIFQQCCENTLVIKIWMGNYTTVQAFGFLVAWPKTWMVVQFPIWNPKEPRTRYTLNKVLIKLRIQQGCCYSTVIVYPWHYFFTYLSSECLILHTYLLKFFPVSLLFNSYRCFQSSD